MSRSINLDDSVYAGYKVCKHYLSANECFRCFKRGVVRDVPSNSAFFFMRSLNVVVCAQRFGVNGDTYVAIPKNSFSSVAIFGIFICRVVSIRSVSGCTPSASKNLICVWLISHFALLKTRPSCRAVFTS